jgi:hypothetical protein
VSENVGIDSSCEAGVTLGTFTREGAHPVIPILVTRRYLESTLGSTLPSFAGEWDAQRRAFPPESPPGESEFLASLRAHVVGLLAHGHVAETSRFFYALERMLSEADPILRELLERDLVATLAAECRQAAIDARRVEPYLGARTRAAWTTSTGERRGDD